MKCYHFCSNNFLNELLEKEVIYADDNLRLIEGEPASYSKAYTFKTKQLNKGNGMFFAWIKPEYKGDIKFDKEGLFSLLELEVAENILIKTNYENWCSLGVDIHDANGDLDLADKYCREDYNMENGLEDSYNAIFEILSPLDAVQILLPYIKKEWIVSMKKCKEKNI